MDYSYDDIYLGKERRKKERFEPCSETLRIEVEKFLSSGGKIKKIENDKRQARHCYIQMSKTADIPIQQTW
jgi:hypothetical protein